MKSVQQVDTLVKPIMSITSRQGAAASERRRRERYHAGVKHAGRTVFKGCLSYGVEC